MPGESILTPIQRSVGVSAIKDSIYKEIEFRKETIMNEVIKAGEVFKLAELLPYQEGKIVNMDLAHNDKMKLDKIAARWPVKAVAQFFSF